MKIQGFQTNQQPEENKLSQRNKLSQTAEKGLAEQLRPTIKAHAKELRKLSFHLKRKILNGKMSINEAKDQLNAKIHTFEKQLKNHLDPTQAPFLRKTVQSYRENSFQFLTTHGLDEHQEDSGGLGARPPGGGLGAKHGLGASPAKGGGLPPFPKPGQPIPPGLANKYAQRAGLPPPPSPNDTNNTNTDPTFQKWMFYSFFGMMTNLQQYMPADQYAKVKAALMPLYNEALKEFQAGKTLADFIKGNNLLPYFTGQKPPSLFLPMANALNTVFKQEDPPCTCYGMLVNGFFGREAGGKSIEGIPTYNHPISDTATISQDSINLCSVQYSLEQLSLPSGSPGNAFVKYLLNYINQNSSGGLSGFQKWFNDNFTTDDPYMHFPGMTQTNLSQIYKALTLGAAPAPTEIDNLFAQVYANNQKDTQAVYNDMLAELKKIGSTGNMKDLQSWAKQEIKTQNFQNSSPTAQAHFLVWTGNVTIDALNVILNEYVGQKTEPMASLASFILSQKFTSLTQMQAFFNPNSSTYGFAKHDIYYYVPQLLGQSNPESFVQGILADIFANQKNAPPTPQPTFSDQAYYQAWNALNNTTNPADQALLKALMQYITQIGSQGSKNSIQAWAGSFTLSSTFQNASAAAQAAFCNAVGLNPKSAAMVAAKLALQNLLSQLDPNSPAFKFLTKVINELGSFISGGKNWSDYKSWLTSQLDKNDIFMQCPGIAGNSKIMQDIYTDLGMGKTLPTETAMDKAYIQVYAQYSNSKTYSQDKILFKDLMQGMFAIGSALSSGDTVSGAIQNYFKNNSSAFSELKNDFNNATTSAQQFFEQIAGSDPNQW